MDPMRFVPDECADDYSDSLNNLCGQLVNCGICGKQFVTKKQLRTHIDTHLRKPRIVLKRVSSSKLIKKKPSDTYWLDPEKKGALKLTLKKQSVADSLKLTLKKSSQSEDFTVVNTNFNADIEDHNNEEVAGGKENDTNDDRTADTSVNSSFDNVIVDQQVGVFFSSLSKCKHKL